MPNHSFSRETLIVWNESNNMWLRDFALDICRVRLLLGKGIETRTKRIRARTRNPWSISGHSNGINLKRKRKKKETKCNSETFSVPHSSFFPKVQTKEEKNKKTGSDVQLQIPTLSSLPVPSWTNYREPSPRKSYQNSCACQSPVKALPPWIIISKADHHRRKKKEERREKRKKKKKKKKKKKRM